MRACKRTHTPRISRKLVVAALCAAGLWTGSVLACSDVMVPPDGASGQVASARTLDFPLADQTILYAVKLQAFERDRRWQSEWKGWGNGKEWRNRYGFVGMHALDYITKALGKSINMDGMNEAGLSAAFLWLDTANYPEAIPERETTSMAFYDVVNYILGSFATVAEAKAALTERENPNFVEVWGPPGFRVVPLHLVVRDATGKSLIVEWTGGKQQVYDGPMVDDVGVLTNDPPYPEQLANLRQSQYQSAKPTNGMLGIPGDSTMPGRFVRLAKLREYALMKRGATPVDAVQVAAHLINNVDVVYGTNREDIPVDDYTGPVLLRDHKARVLYFKGNNNQSYRKIVIGDVDFGRVHADGILADPLPSDPIYSRYEFGQDVTALLNASAQSEPGPSGTVSVASLTVTVPEAQSTVENGVMFVYALTPDGEAKQWAAGQWLAVNTWGVLIPVFQGRLQTRTFEVPVTPLPVGSEVFVGYGRSALDMLVRQQQTLAYLVPAPAPTPPSPATSRAQASR